MNDYGPRRAGRLAASNEMFYQFAAFLTLVFLASLAMSQPALHNSDLKAALSDASETRQAAALRQEESRRLTRADVDWLLECLGWKGGKLGRANLNLAMNSAYLLGCARDPQAVPALIAGLDHRNGGMQNECLLALAKIGDKRAVPPICAYLDAKKGAKMTRGAAGYALGVLGDPGAIPTLIPMLFESGRVFPNWDLLRIGDASIDPLIDVLTKAQRPDPAWVFTLGELRAARALPLLKSLASRPDRKGHLTRAVLYACRKINGPEARAVLQSVMHQSPDADIGRLAARLLADANAPANLPAQCPDVERVITDGTAEERTQTLALLDRMIDSFDVNWRVKEQARAQATRLRMRYRFTGKPQVWDSLVYFVPSVKTVDGVLHSGTPQEEASARKVFESFVPELDAVSQGRLQLRLHYKTDNRGPQLADFPDGFKGLPRQVIVQAEEARKAIGADHMFVVWVVPDGVKPLPYTNGGACSHIPLKRIDGVRQCAPLGALHEMVHSMNNCLWGVGYEEGQMPNLHYGVAQILYQAKRLDGTTPDRVTDYLRCYFTGSMWASLSRANEVVLDHPEDTDAEQ